MAASAPYIELHAHSAFSFLDGASTPTELAHAAAALGYPAFALTDHDGIWGSREFAQTCKELPQGVSLRPITGAELTVAIPESSPPPASTRRSTTTSPPVLAHLTLLAETEAGYR